MDQEMMQLKHELKEFVEKGQHILAEDGRKHGSEILRNAWWSVWYSGGNGGNLRQPRAMDAGRIPTAGAVAQNVDPRWFM